MHSLSCLEHKRMQNRFLFFFGLCAHTHAGWFIVLSVDGQESDDVLCGCLIILKPQFVHNWSVVKSFSDHISEPTLRHFNLFIWSIPIDSAVSEHKID